MDRLQEAVRWAVELHADQWRDGDAPLPYITHPIEVMAFLRHVGGVTDENLLIVAALHDVVEETDVTLAEVKKRFGKRVADLLNEVTREEPTDEQIQGMTKDEIWALRSGMLLEEIKRMSPDAQRVKLADRLSNVKGAHQTKTGKKLKRYIDQSHEILRIIKRDVNPGLWDAIEKEIN